MMVISSSAGTGNTGIAVKLRLATDQFKYLKLPAEIVMKDEELCREKKRWEKRCSSTTEVFEGATLLTLSRIPQSKYCTSVSIRSGERQATGEFLTNLWYFSVCSATACATKRCEGKRCRQYVQNCNG